MSSKHKRSLTFSFSFRKKQKINQPLDDASKKTVNFADACLNKEDFSTAEVIIKDMIKRYPYNSDCLWLFGRLFVGQKRYKKAISRFKQALELLPSHAPTLCSYGELLFVLKKYDEAEEMYEQCLVSDTSYHRCHYSYGQLHIFKQNVIEAEKHYISAIELSKAKNEPVIAYHLTYGELLSASNRHEEACTHFETAISLDDQNDKAYFLFTKCLANMGKILLAVRNIKNAIKINPKNEKYMTYLHDLNRKKAKQQRDSLKLQSQKSVQMTKRDENTPTDAVSEPGNRLSNILEPSKSYQSRITDSLSVRDLLGFLEQTQDEESEEQSEEVPDDWGHGTKFEVRQMHGEKDESYHDILDVLKPKDSLKDNDIIHNPTDDQDVAKEQKQNGNGATAPTDEPGHDAAVKQLHLFLKSCRLEQYFGALRETGCADIRDIEYANEDIFEDIVFKSKMHKRRLIGECKKLRKQMDEFRKETKANGIPSIVVDELSDFGIVTMDILCKEVGQKSDLKDKFEIGNARQCEMLWTMIDQYLHPVMHHTNSVTHGQDTEEIAEMEQQEGVPANANVMDTAFRG